MSKKMSKLDIMNAMGDAADKKAKAFAGKETPEEEAAEETAPKKKPNQMAAIKAKAKMPFPKK